MIISADLDYESKNHEVLRPKVTCSWAFWQAYNFVDSLTIIFWHENTALLWKTPFSDWQPCFLIVFQKESNGMDWLTHENSVLKPWAYSSTVLVKIKGWTIVRYLSTFPLKKFGFWADCSQIHFNGMSTAHTKSKYIGRKQAFWKYDFYFYIGLPIAVIEKKTEGKIASLWLPLVIMINYFISYCKNLINFTFFEVFWLSFKKMFSESKVI